MECRIYLDKSRYRTPLYGIDGVHFMRVKIPIGGIGCGLLMVESWVLIL